MDKPPFISSHASEIRERGGIPNASAGTRISHSKLFRQHEFKFKAVFWLILVPLFAFFGSDGTRAQTKLSLSKQVSPLPSIVVVQYATCTGLPACKGMEYAQFKMSDGSTRGPFWLIPTDPTFALNNNWTAFSVTVPGTSGITCAQVKP